MRRPLISINPTDWTRDVPSLHFERKQIGPVPNCRGVNPVLFVGYSILYSLKLPKQNNPHASCLCDYPNLLDEKKENAFCIITLRQVLHFYITVARKEGNAGRVL